MNRIIKILRQITILGVTLPLVTCIAYWVAIAIKFGQFPPDLSDSKWRPLHSFRPIVYYAIIVLGISLIPYLIMLMASLAKGWRPSRKAFILEALLVLILFFFLRTDFVSWFLD